MLHRYRFIYHILQLKARSDLRESDVNYALRNSHCVENKPGQVLNLVSDAFFAELEKFLILRFTQPKYLPWFPMRNSHAKNAPNLASLYEP